MRIELQEQLLKSIQDGDLSLDDLISLSGELARGDTNRVRFSVDASHISRLGLELVSRQETAVAELVKNAYDADATLVDLIFYNHSAPGGVLEILDNGTGMTFEQLVDGFMRLSTPDKLVHPHSPSFKRRRAGKKGIGRFATQRLGTQLIITTQHASLDYALEVAIDWSLFERSVDLQSISSEIRQVGKRSFPGTTLRIEGLRDAWTVAQIRRSHRYVSNLLQPFPVRPVMNQPTVDPGFAARFFTAELGDLTIVADEETSVLGYALAVIEGHVDQSGHAYWSFHSDKLGENAGPEPLILAGMESEGGWNHLKNVGFKAYYFIQTSKYISKVDIPVVRAALQERGGVRLYRNGFRVLPYGEQYDDWLSLDAAAKTRSILVPISNNNFLGIVEIRDDNENDFEETSSREGLVENEAYRQLQQFVFRAISTAVLRIASIRGRKTKSGSGATRPKTPTQPTQGKEPSDLETTTSAPIVPTDTENPFDEPGDGSVAETTEEMLGILEQIQADALQQRVSEPELLERLQLGISAIGMKTDLLLEEQAMLRVLASLGLTIGEFTHEIRTYLGALIADINELSRRDVSEEIRDLAESASKGLNALSSYAKYFDSAVTDNAHRQLSHIEIRDVVNSFETTIRPTLVRENIELVKEISGYALFTKPMHRSEWASILLNLFTNSVKAIKRARRHGKILIRGSATQDWLTIEFIDNGVGIPPQNQERVFDAFFTTSAAPGPFANESEDLVGTGLGLKIVRDIIEANGGEIRVSTAPDGYSTSFQIGLPRAGEDEIPEDEF